MRHELKLLHRSLRLPSLVAPPSPDPRTLCSPRLRLRLGLMLIVPPVVLGLLMSTVHHPNVFHSCAASRLIDSCWLHRQIGLSGSREGKAEGRSRAEADSRACATPHRHATSSCSPGQCGCSPDGGRHLQLELQRSSRDQLAAARCEHAAAADECTAHSSWREHSCSCIAGSQLLDCSTAQASRLRRSRDDVGRSRCTLTARQDDCCHRYA